MDKRSEEGWGGSKYWTPLFISEGLTAAPLFARQVWLLHSCLYTLKNLVCDAIRFSVHPASHPHSTHNKLVVCYHIYLFFAFPLLNLPSCSNSICTCCFFVLLLILQNPYSHTSTSCFFWLGHSHGPNSQFSRNHKAQVKGALFLCTFVFYTLNYTMCFPNCWQPVTAFRAFSISEFDKFHGWKPFMSNLNKWGIQMQLSCVFMNSMRCQMTSHSNSYPGLEHLLSEEWLCPKEIVPKEKWSAWKCTQL